jgi:hypothetical protein
LGGPTAGGCGDRWRYSRLIDLMQKRKYLLQLMAPFGMTDIFKAGFFFLMVA